MTTRLKITVDELSSTPVRITAGGEEKILEPTQTHVFEGDDIRSEPISMDEVRKSTGNSPSGDVWQHGNPNGINRAEIAPKLPKASGELEDVMENGRLVQRQIAPYGLGEQGGGVESEAGETPGPQPSEVEGAPRGSGNAAAAGKEESGDPPASGGGGRPSSTQRPEAKDPKGNPSTSQKK